MEICVCLQLISLLFCQTLPGIFRPRGTLENAVWTVVSEMRSKFHAFNVFPALEAAAVREGSMRVGATLASLNGRMPPNTETPRKPKRRIAQDQGPDNTWTSDPQAQHCKAFNWFLLRWLNFPPVAFPSCSRPMYFPTWDRGCQPAAQLAGRCLEPLQRDS